MSVLDMVAGVKIPSKSFANDGCGSASMYIDNLARMSKDVRSACVVAGGEHALTVLISVQDVLVCVTQGKSIRNRRPLVALGPFARSSSLLWGLWRERLEKFRLSIRSTSWREERGYVRGDQVAFSARTTYTHPVLASSFRPASCLSRRCQASTTRALCFHPRCSSIGCDGSYLVLRAMSGLRMLRSPFRIVEVKSLSTLNCRSYNVNTNFQQTHLCLERLERSIEQRRHCSTTQYPANPLDSSVRHTPRGIIDWSSRLEILN